MTKEDSDYEDKVRNFLEETAQYKRNRKMQELGQQLQPVIADHDKKKKKKKDKLVCFICWYAIIIHYIKTLSKIDQIQI